MYIYKNELYLFNTFNLLKLEFGLHLKYWNEYNKIKYRLLT